MTTLGVNSRYHVWEPISERFVQNNGLGENINGNIFIHGKDEVISNRYLT